MTIFEIDRIIGKNTLERSDRGGKKMNLFSIILMKSDSDDRRRQPMNQVLNPTDDYGYQLYKSLEYNTKRREKDNTGSEQIPVNTFIR